MTETGLKFTKDDESSFDKKEELLSNSLKTKTSLPFKNNGECSDEVVLSFDDGKKLYVSENFLCYASPVFKAMFTHECKEMETKEVVMKEKVFDDVLEFLLCLHPGVQKPIDNDNVLRVVSFAEEYQVDVSVKRCQNVMKNWLLCEVESALKTNDTLKKTTSAGTCLNILTKAEACGFEELVTNAIQIIARFGHEVFTGSVKATQNASVFRPASPRRITRVVRSARRTTQRNTGMSSGYGQTVPISETQIGGENEQSKSEMLGNPYKLPTFPSAVGKPPCPIAECKNLYESLPEELKTRLLLQRLRLCDDGEMY